MTPISPSSRCVLLFSGGRDSALAAVKLAKTFSAVDLLTITSDHLVGAPAVHRRLDEISRLGLPKMRWTRVQQLPHPHAPNAHNLASHTCLPCQQNYLYTGIVWAMRNEADSVAMGYTTYQSDWPEQTPLAIEMMERILQTKGLRLQLPVYDTESKDQARSQLREIGLSEESLEQKCLKQIFNRALTERDLDTQVKLIETNLTAALSLNSDVGLKILEQREIG